MSDSLTKAWYSSWEADGRSIEPPPNRVSRSLKEASKPILGALDESQVRIWAMRDVSQWLWLLIIGYLHVSPDINGTSFSAFLEGNQKRTDPESRSCQGKGNFRKSTKRKEEVDTDEKM
jgi:hypothetical protein